MTQYVPKSDMKLWNEIMSLPKEKIIDMVLEKFDGDGILEDEFVLEALKSHLGREYKITSAQPKKFFLENGWTEDELVEVSN